MRALVVSCLVVGLAFAVHGAASVSRRTLQEEARNHRPHLHRLSNKRFVPSPRHAHKASQLQKSHLPSNTSRSLYAEKNSYQPYPPKDSSRRKEQRGSSSDESSSDTKSDDPDRANSNTAKIRRAQIEQQNALNKRTVRAEDAEIPKDKPPEKVAIDSEAAEQLRAAEQSELAQRSETGSNDPAEQKAEVQQEEVAKVPENASGSEETERSEETAVEGHKAAADDSAEMSAETDNEDDEEKKEAADSELSEGAKLNAKLEDESQDSLEKMLKDVKEVAQKTAAKIQGEFERNLTRRKEAAPGGIQVDGDESEVQLHRNEPSQEERSPPKLQTSFGNQMLTEGKLWEVRQALVTQAMQSLWAEYEQYAFGYDELLPLSKMGVNNHGGMSAMLLANLDTLHMMGLADEYQRALSWVANNLTLSHRTNVSLSDTVHNCVGGLLGAYELSQDPLFLEKAAALTSMLLTAFEGGVFPARFAALNHESPPTSVAVLLSEFGSLQMELWALSQRIKTPELGDLATFSIRFIDETYEGKGLLPAHFKRETGEFESSSWKDGIPEVSMGAGSAQYYESLVKLWLLVGKQEESYRRMWQKAMDEALELLYSATLDGSVVIGKRRASVVEVRLEHLTCFLPGVLAFGALQGAVDAAKLWFYMDNASKLMETCWRMYERTATGLAPDDFHVSPSDVNVVESGNPANELWPQTAASLVYMWRATKDPKFKFMGWSIFRSLQEHSRVGGGAFATIQDVNSVPASPKNSMPLHVTQTLKHLWMLFGPENTLNTGWVLTVGGHPLRMSTPLPQEATA